MADISDHIESFLAYLKVEKISSPVTIYDYNKELQKFNDFLIENNIFDLFSIGTRVIRKYFYYAKDSRILIIKPLIINSQFQMQGPKYISLILSDLDDILTRVIKYCKQR